MPLFAFDMKTPFIGPSSQKAFKYEFAPGADPANNAGAYASIVNDPGGVIDTRTGLLRRVIQMATLNSARTASGAVDSGARCQLETWAQWTENVERWEGFALRFPNSFPKSKTIGSGWHVVHGSYGTNPSGNSPLRFDLMKRGTNADGSSGIQLMMMRSHDYGFEVPWVLRVGGANRTIDSIRNTWIDIVLRHKFGGWSGGLSGGFLEIYVNAGNGWERQPFTATTTYHATTADGFRMYYKTSDPATNGTPPFDTSIRNYYQYDSYGGVTPVIFHGVHRIDTAFSEVNPFSHANQAGAPGAVVVVPIGNVWDTIGAHLTRTDGALRTP